MNPRTSIRRSKMTTGNRGRRFILTTEEAIPRVISYRQFILDTLSILYPLFLLNRQLMLIPGQIDPSVQIEPGII